MQTNAVTTIANAPEFIKDVINLRGIIVPIVDMRIKFKPGKIGYDESTVVKHTQRRQPRVWHGGGRRLQREHAEDGHARIQACICHAW